MSNVSVNGVNLDFENGNVVPALRISFLSNDSKESELLKKVLGHSYTDTLMKTMGLDIGKKQSEKEGEIQERFFIARVAPKSNPQDKSKFDLATGDFVELAKGTMKKSYKSIEDIPVYASPLYFEGMDTPVTLSEALSSIKIVLKSLEKGKKNFYKNTPQKEIASHLTKELKKVKKKYEHIVQGGQKSLKKNDSILLSNGIFRVASFNKAMKSFFSKPFVMDLAEASGVVCSFESKGVRFAKLGDLESAENMFANIKDVMNRHELSLSEWSSCIADLQILEKSFNKVTEKRQKSHDGIVKRLEILKLAIYEIARKKVKELEYKEKIGDVSEVESSDAESDVTEEKNAVNDREELKFNFGENVEITFTAGENNTVEESVQYCVASMINLDDVNYDKKLTDSALNVEYLFRDSDGNATVLKGQEAIAAIDSNFPELKSNFIDMLQESGTLTIKEDDVDIDGKSISEGLDGDVSLEWAREVISNKLNSVPHLNPNIVIGENFKQFLIDANKKQEAGIYLNIGGEVYRDAEALEKLSSLGTSNDVVNPFTQFSGISEGIGDASKLTYTQGGSEYNKDEKALSEALSEGEATQDTSINSVNGAQGTVNDKDVREVDNDKGAHTK